MPCFILLTTSTTTTKEHVGFFISYKFSLVSKIGIALDISDVVTAIIVLFFYATVEDITHFTKQG